MPFDGNAKESARKVRALRCSTGAVIEAIESRLMMSASSLDTTFGALHSGKVVENITSTSDSANAIKALSNGTYLVAGGDGSHFAVARFTAAGLPDTTFGAGTGKLTTSFSPAGGKWADDAFGIALLSGGKFLVAGTGNGDFALARYNANGTLDTSFGPAHTGEVTTSFFGLGDAASSLAIQPDGKIVLVGTVRTSAGNTEIGVARFTAAGSLDTTFGSAHTGRVVYSFQKQSDSGASVAIVGGNKILIGGTVTWAASGSAPATSDLALLRLNPSGSLDTTFAVGGADGNGIVTIDFSLPTDKTRRNDYFDDMSLCCCGEIAIVGTTTASVDSQGNPSYDIAVAKLKLDGTLDVSFNKTGKATIDYGSPVDIGRSVQLLSNDKILVTGTTDEGSGSTPSGNFALARFNSNGTLDTTFAAGGKTYTDLASGSNEDAHALAVAPGGSFVIAGASNGDFALARYLGDKNVGPDHCTGTISHKTAVPIGQSASGAITSSNGVDLYPITVTAGQTIGFDVDGASGSSFDPYLRIFDSAGNELAAVDNAKPAGKTTGTAGEAYLAYTFAAGGSYYYGISGAGNTLYDINTGDSSFAGSTGAYIFSTTNLTSPTIGQFATLSTAFLVNVGSSISGSIDFGTDVNVYKFSAAAGERVSFNINVSSGSVFDSYLRLFDGSGAMLAFNDNGAGPGESLGKSSYFSYTFSSGGTYYIGVSGAANISYNVVNGSGGVSGSTGSYVLVISQVTTSGDSTLSKAIGTSIGSTITDSIWSATVVNLYSFVVISGQTIGFNINQISGSSLDSYLRLFDSSGNMLAYNNDGAAPGETLGKSSYLTYTFNNGGTYYIGVSGYPNTSYNVVTGAGSVGGSVGGYTLAINNIPTTIDNDYGDKISQAAAIAVGQTVSATLEISTDVDLYKFTVAAGHRIGFNVNGSVDTYVRVFDANGYQLAANDNGAAPGETLGKAAYVEYTFEASGTYYVGVSGNPNTNYDVISGSMDVAGATGAYTLQMSYVGENDPQDQISEAQPLAVGGTVTSAIDLNVDVDMFSFTAAAGQRIGFDCRLTSASQLTSELRLFDGSVAQLSYSIGGVAPGESSSGASSYLEYQFTAGGTYYIGVSGDGNYEYNPVTGLYDQSGLNLGGYTLKLNALSTGADADYRISGAEPIAIGQKITDALSFSTEVELYKFTAKAGQTIAFDINKAAGATADFYLEIFDASGYYVSYNDNGAAPGETYGTDPYLEYTFNNAGTYYAGVSAMPNDNYNPVTGGNVVSGGLGGYTFSTSDVATQDPNDQITEAGNISIGQTINDAITTPSDVNLYRFTAVAGQTVSFNINTPSGSKLDAYLEIFDSQGYYVSFNDNGAAPGETYAKDPYLEYTFTKTGTYYVGISSMPNDNYNVITGGGDQYDSTTGIGTYTLILSDVGKQDPNDQISEATPISTNTVINGTIDTPIDVDVYGFTVAAGQTVTFTLNRTSGNLNPYLEIADANGYYVTFGYGGSLQYTFTKAGTYYAAVSDTANENFDLITGGGKQYGNTGGYTLRLS